MKCAEARALFSVYLDKSLMLDQRIGMEEHLGVCERCTADLQEFRRLLADLHSLHAVPTPEDIRRKVYSHIVQQRNARARAASQPSIFSVLLPWQSSARAALSYTGLTLASATLVFALLFTPRILRHYQNPQDETAGARSSIPGKSPQIAQLPPPVQPDTDRASAPKDSVRPSPAGGTDQEKTALPQSPPVKRRPSLSSSAMITRIRGALGAKKTPSQDSGKQKNTTYLAQVPGPPSLPAEAKGNVSEVPLVKADEANAPQKLEATAPQSFARVTAATEAQQDQAVANGKEKDRDATADKATVAAPPRQLAMQAAAPQPVAARAAARVQPQTVTATGAASGSPQESAAPNAGATKWRQLARPALRAVPAEIQAAEPVLDKAIKVLALQTFDVSVPRRIPVGKSSKLAIEIKPTEPLTNATVKIRLPAQVSLLRGKGESSGGEQEVYSGALRSDQITRLIVDLKPLAEGDYTVILSILSKELGVSQIERVVVLKVRKP